MIKFSKTDDKYGCFSNFYKCKIIYDGLEYKSSEAAWQAQKTLDVNEREQFCNYTAYQSKKLGRSVKLRSDWESVKYNLMIDVCYAKFNQNTDLKEILLSTGDEELVENTTGWHDNIWGNCECPRCINKVGQNLLGKALMEVRKLIRNQ